MCEGLTSFKLCQNKCLILLSSLITLSFLSCFRNSIAISKCLSKSAIVLPIPCSISWYFCTFENNIIGRFSILSYRFMICFFNPFRMVISFMACMYLQCNSRFYKISCIQISELRICPQEIRSLSRQR